MLALWLMAASVGASVKISWIALMKKAIFLAAAVLLPASSAHAVTFNFVTFNSTQQVLPSTTITTPSGGSRVISGTFNVNANGTPYENTPDSDILIMSNQGDFLDELSAGQPLQIENGFEIISLGDGSDVLLLSDIAPGAPRTGVTVSGSIGNDIVAGASGDDTITGDTGDDLLDGAGGNDVLEGGFGNDIIFGGVGDDLLNPGDSFNQLFGGSGSDRYVLDYSSFGTSTSAFTEIVDPMDGDIDWLEFQDATTLADIETSVDGKDLLISITNPFYTSLGVRIVGQFDTPESGLDFISFADSSELNLRMAPVPLPASGLLLTAGVLGLWGRKRCARRVKTETKHAA